MMHVCPVVNGRYLISDYLRFSVKSNPGDILKKPTVINTVAWLHFFFCAKKKPRLSRAGC